MTWNFHNDASRWRHVSYRISRESWAKMAKMATFNTLTWVTSEPSELDRRCVAQHLQENKRKIAPGGRQQLNDSEHAKCGGVPNVITYSVVSALFNTYPAYSLHVFEGAEPERSTCRRSFAKSSREFEHHVGVFKTVRQISDFRHRRQAAPS